MRNGLLFLLLAACALEGCKSSTSSSSVPAVGATAKVNSNPSDPVEQKLREIAGGGAKSCGVIATQAVPEMDAASKCALDAAKSKQAFYVEYQLPGMNVAVAGDAQGKLYSVQSQAGGAGLVSGDCPAELRVAPSGRVTCYAPGTFPMGAGAGSHSQMTMPSMGGTGSKLPPGHPDPHQSQKTPPSPNQL